MTLSAANNLTINIFIWQHRLCNSSKANTSFTDRSIYRPGQTIYFKGIITQRDGENIKYFPMKNASITLKDVNYQDVKSLNFISNDFRSFTGTFVAPI